MPSHIFTRVGFWKELIASNIASVKAARADKSASDQLHGQDYMVYAYLQLAQDKQRRARSSTRWRRSENFNPEVVRRSIRAARQARPAT